MPLDDIKDSMIALANEEKQMSDLLNYNFRYGKLRGLSFSDIFFSNERSKPRFCKISNKQQ